MVEAAATLLDAIDRKVLRLVQADGRITNAALAEAVGLTPTPMLQRVRKLEQAGVIRGYVGLVDGAKVGKSTTAFVQVKLREHSSKSHKRFVDEMAAVPEVLEVHHVAGEEDFLLKVVVRDIAQYESLLLGWLNRIAGIDRVTTTFVLSTRKAETAVPIDDVEGP